MFEFLCGALLQVGFNSLELSGFVPAAIQDCVLKNNSDIKSGFFFSAANFYDTIHYK